MHSGSSSFFWVCLAVILGTFILRSMFVIKSGQAHFPEIFKSATYFAVISIFAALVIPVVLSPVGEVSFLLGKERMVAGLFAALVGWKFRSLPLTIAAGLGALYLLEWINMEPL